MHPEEKRRKEKSSEAEEPKAYWKNKSISSHVYPSFVIFCWRGREGQGGKEVRRERRQEGEERRGYTLHPPSRLDAKN